MPRSGSDDRELTDEELETVVGGSKLAQHETSCLFENWRRHVKEDVDLKVGSSRIRRRIQS